MPTAIEIEDRISKCQKILDSDPNSQIFAALAEAYRKKGDLENAFNSCKNGLRIHPKYGAAHLVMAKINLDKGLYDWAGVEVQKAIELDGKTRAVELLLAEIHIYKGEYKTAINFLKKLNQNDPQNSQVRKLLDIALKIPDEQTIITPKEEKPPVQRPQEYAPIEAGTSPSEKKSDKPEDIVAESVSIPGVDGALFINDEGLVVESKWMLKFDEHVCGASMMAIKKHLNQDLGQNSFGNVETVLIETETFNYYQVAVPEGLYAFVAQASANLGSIRMKIENLFKNR